MKDIIFFKKGMFLARCEAFNDSFKIQETIVNALELPYNIDNIKKVNLAFTSYYFIPEKDLNFKKGIPAILDYLPNKIEKYWMGSINIEITEDILRKILNNFTYISED